MLKIITPPQRGIDDPIMFIDSTDDAIDHERIVGEQLRLGTIADRPHPATQWFRGEYGFSLEAPLTVPEELRKDGEPATATISHWFKPAALPAYFELRVLTALEWEQATHRLEVADLEVCRRAIVRVHNVDDGTGSPVTIEPPRKLGLITQEWMDALSFTDRDVIGRIAWGVERMKAGHGAEGKP